MPSAQHSPLSYAVNLRLSLLGAYLFQARLMGLIGEGEHDGERGFIII